MHHPTLGSRVLQKKKKKKKVDFPQELSPLLNTRKKAR
jgi:hypothetical protein